MWGGKNVFVRSGQLEDPGTVRRLAPDACVELIRARFAREFVGSESVRVLAQGFE
jgi:hypothetical protein